MPDVRPATSVEPIFQSASSIPSDLTLVDRMLADLDVTVEHHAPIGATMTWYGLGGSADTLVIPRSVQALQTLVRRCHETRTPLRILGSGANLLVADEGVDGVVVHLSDPVFSEKSYIHRHRPHRAGNEGKCTDAIRMAAGAGMEKLVMSMAGQGMSGIEQMAGIPASLGGAIRMNAGGRFGTIADSIAAVGCIALDGSMVVYERDRIEFGYRQCSIIDPVILWAELALKPADPARVHERVKEIFAYKKQSQPLAAASAGCAFKNPIDRDDPSRRLSAGQLIDQAGLKGCRIGGAVISDKHANFFIAAEGRITGGSATPAGQSKGGCANDLIALMNHAARVVLERTGYELHREVVVWSRRGSQHARSDPGRISD